jgi:iron complex outermembrane receptor protein
MATDRHRARVDRGRLEERMLGLGDEPDVPADMSSRVLRIAVVGMMLLTAICARAESEQRLHAQTDLTGLSLEQLGEIVVTSVSRREERWSEAAASIFVITAEDIRRSGATTLPEALRLAPNLDVARADANQYAISARGFNNVLANKMLVLVDGRTVYTPLFSGVFWEAQHVMLEDVDRIEVISGPGATLWGANAVNGVINVISRTAAQTQGTLASVHAGGRERGGSVRYGGEFAQGAGAYRVYGTARDLSSTRRENGAGIRDGSALGQAGFRTDWSSGASALTLSGDAYRSRIEQDPEARTIGGANVVARWTRRIAEDQSFQVQAYHDHTYRDQPGTFRESLDTFDVQLQHGIRLAGRHRVLWGGGYRYAIDRVENSAVLAFLPPDRTLRWANVFVQDEIALTDAVALTLGGKQESNPYTGSEFLPNVRLAWRPAPGRFVWGAFSRAVRAPARIDREYFVPGNAPFVIAGGPSFVSEIAAVTELGYRMQVSPAVSFSVTAFHSRYDRLRSVEPKPGGAELENRIDGKTWGTEGWASVRVTDAWRLIGGGTVLRERLEREEGSRDVIGLPALGNDPRFWWSVRSQFDVTSRHTFDVGIRRVGARRDPQVPAYTAVDARLGWRATRNLELALVGRNLLDPGHVEWGAAVNRSESARTVLLQAVWRP